MKILRTAVLGLAGACATAFSAPFSSLVVYGDSLSDTGATFAAFVQAGLPGYPPSPYFQGRFSNGPVSSELLAASLNAPLLNFSYGGATTGDGNSVDGGTVTSMNMLPGMRPAFDATSGSLTPALLASGLFVVWGGANDFVAPSPSDTTGPAIAQRAAGNISYIVSQLQALGAQRILVPGMPDLGLTPSFRSGSGPISAADATALSIYFNNLLQATLPANATYVDTFHLLGKVAANPAAYGLTNVTDACFDPSVGICSNPGEYLFWDEFHPTTAGHAILAAAIASNAVPEPSTAGLAIVAFLVCAVMKSVGERRQA